MKNRRLRMGMVGGGNGAFIGSVHRRAAFMENEIELVCGCFSTDPQISLESGLSYHVDKDRIYKDYKEMFEKESKRTTEDRMDFVSIVTPNYCHFEPAMLALDNGFNVVLDKPMTFSLEEAKLLQKKVKETGLTLALTHVYSGYPAAKELKARIARGDLGNIRRIFVEYHQGWLSKRIELEGGNNAGWRTDPKRSGKAGCVGDIGTHAWHLCEYVLGAKVTEVCAELLTFVEGRPIDDDGAAFLHFDNGVKGILSSSQIATGEENNLNIRIYGENGGLEWNQMEPNTILAKWHNKPVEVIRMGNNNGYLNSETLWNTRVPSGHPEGFIEAFSNIYRNFSLTVKAKINNETPKLEWLDFPNVDDGVRGMQFIETMVAAGYEKDKKWQKWIK